MNLPTIIVGGLVLVAFLAVVVRGIQNHRRGKHGCSCGDCGSCGMCHSQKDVSR